MNSDFYNLYKRVLKKTTFTLILIFFTLFDILYQAEKNSERNMIIMIVNVYFLSAESMRDNKNEIKKLSTFVNLLKII